MIQTHRAPPSGKVAVCVCVGFGYMTDVTSILAADTAAAAAAEDGAEDVAMGAGGGLSGIPLAAGASRGRKRLALPKKPAGMSREVYELMVKQGVDLPTIVSGA